MHADRLKNKKFKTLFKALLLVILSLSFIFLLFGLSLSPNIKNDKISTINIKAKNHFNFFTAYYNDLLNSINIPDNGSFYIMGQCKENAYYIIDAGGLILKDDVIYGNKNEINGYWAINIVDNKIVQVWSSNYPLSREQLIPYSIDDQKKQFKIFESTLKTKAIGYFENQNFQRGVLVD